MDVADSAKDSSHHPAMRFVHLSSAVFSLAVLVSSVAAGRL